MSRHEWHPLLACGDKARFEWNAPLNEGINARFTLNGRVTEKRAWGKLVRDVPAKTKWRTRKWKCMKSARILPLLPLFLFHSHACTSLTSSCCCVCFVSLIWVLILTLLPDRQAHPGERAWTQIRVCVHDRDWARRQTNSWWMFQVKL